MTLDTANRAFLAVLAVAFAAYMLGGLGACAVFSLVAYKVSTDGLGVLSSGGAGLQLGLIFLAITGTGTILGLLSVRRQLNATEELTASVRARRMPVTENLLAAASGVGLGRRLDLVDAPEVFSFAYGFFRPRVVVSRGLVETLSPAELEAVLAHERYHVRNFDPAKIFLARAIGASFFWLPLLDDLRRRYVAGRELAADRRAVSLSGRASLAGALYKVVGGPAWGDLSTAAAIGGPELLDVRVEQLEEGAEPPLAHVSRRAVWLSAAGVTIVLITSIAALAGAGGPFAAMRQAMPAGSAGPVMALGMSLCAAFWAWVAWRLLRYARIRGLTLRSRSSTTSV